MSLEKCVQAYLELAMLPPEKPPKTQRAQRENEAIIIGFNRAQETLRKILATHGQSKATKALAETRAEGQRQPMKGPGGISMWVMG